MSAPKNNNYAMKFKTPEERQALCQKWYEHRSKGFSQESFPDCDYDTIERYVKDFPEDFPSIKMQEAERNCYKFWEEQGMNGMWAGKSFNPVVWIFNMKNRFKWRDNVDVTSDGQKVDTLNGLFGLLNARKTDTGSEPTETN